MSLRGTLHRRRETWPRALRGATSKWIVVPLTLVAVLAAAGVGYGAYTRSQPTVYARGGAAFAATPDGAAPSRSAAPRPAAAGRAQAKRGPATAPPRAIGAAGAAGAARSRPASTPGARAAVRAARGQGPA